jgi:hypothetical protein
MNREEVLKMIISPIEDDYFPEKFVQECSNLNAMEYADPIDICDKDLIRIREKTTSALHDQIEVYCSMLADGSFPHLWTFSDEGYNFDFSANFEDFKQGEGYFSIGSDPSGNWFVLNKDHDSKVLLCDKYSLEITPEWINPNHFFAWAVRVVLADENGIDGEEVIGHWKVASDKIPESTASKIADSL